MKERPSITVSAPAIPSCTRKNGSDMPRKSAASRIIRISDRTDVVVGREIDEGAALDHRLGPGNPLVHAKERIGYAEKIRSFANHPDFRSDRCSCRTRN